MQVSRDLAEAARLGDPAAFEALVRQTHRSVYCLVFRILGNHDDAVDVTQEVYIRVWRGLRRFRGDANLGTWIHRVATNAALSWVRQNPSAPGSLDPEAHEAPDAVEDGEAALDARLVREALARLPGGQRAVVVLKEMYGWSCEEIGRQMGITEGAVKVRLFRARTRLADDLERSEVVPLGRRKRKRVGGSP
ncbi:MAG: RNA polymerase sigma factor [Acidobacteria bacterium]|nr:RNA polymerase sigma factor [Acidobacteriota bacterium]